MKMYNIHHNYINVKVREKYIKKWNVHGYKINFTKLKNISKIYTVFIYLFNENKSFKIYTMFMYYMMKESDFYNLIRVFKLNATQFNIFQIYF